MVVVVVQSGLARSIILEIEAAIPDKLLNDVEQVLNERLSGLTLLYVTGPVTGRGGVRRAGASRL
jgi:transcriptional regulator of heat shock response